MAEKDVGCTHESPKLRHAGSGYVCELATAHEGPHRAFTWQDEADQPAWDDEGNIVADPKGDFGHIVGNVSGRAAGDKE